MLLKILYLTLYDREWNACAHRVHIVPVNDNDYDFVKTHFHAYFEVVIPHELEDTSQLRQDSFLRLIYTQRYLFTTVIAYEQSLILV